MGKKNTAKKQSPNQPIDNENPEVPGGSDSGALFESEAAEQTLAEDPLFLFLKDKWQALVWVAVAVFVVLYAQDAFEANRRSNLERGSEVFSRMRREFQQLKGIDDTSSEAYTESLDRLKGYMSALKDEYEPYKNLGSLYEGLLAAEQGDKDAVLAHLTSADWQAIAVEDRQKRMIAELGAMALARYLIDDPSTSQKGKNALYTLGAEGQYASVSSALTYVRLVEGEDEVVKAMQLLQQLIQTAPEQAELVEPELARLEAKTQ